MVEDEIDIEMIAVKRNAMLSGNERKTVAEFQQKILEVVDKC